MHTFSPVNSEIFSRPSRVGSERIDTLVIDSVAQRCRYPAADGQFPVLWTPRHFALCGLGGPFTVV
jgi:hypothetical protein